MRQIDHICMYMYMYVYIYIYIYIYIKYIFNSMFNGVFYVSSRLSPQWLCGNSCMWVCDVRVHIASINELKTADKFSKELIIIQYYEISESGNIVRSQSSLRRINILKILMPAKLTGQLILFLYSLKP